MLDVRMGRPGREVGFWDERESLKRVRDGGLGLGVGVEARMRTGSM